MLKTRAALIGCGGMARNHLNQLLKQLDTTDIVALCDPQPEALAASAQKFSDAGLMPPPTWVSLESLLVDIGSELDAVFIITPHAFHHDQTVACLEAGLDVLLEKPMALNATQALSMIETRDRTGRLLVIAFQGSLSPEVRMAVKLLRSGELGPILTINAVAWQGWKDVTTGTWRQEPALSGGGFLFDTGAHMLNTVADLAGEPFVEVAAWTDPQGTPVDIIGTAIGRLASGALVTFNACGDTINVCESDVRVFCRDGILQTGIWGASLRVQRRGETQLRAMKCPPSLGVWQQFLAVRRGKMPNPSPPEIGLRMIRLWDALHASAQQGGQPVKCEMG
ncbi:MAG: Gfo/Idh/MocA family oxidoreductase [Anaerolineaceae bacterium]|nr:Gfo/Idh/MocA family oxidoreductase [Anaerolineaceae bacterium]MCB9098693.1 Gfo/Idh/MocA family oxidoreductase [Anaerolineales bacterium]